MLAQLSTPTCACHQYCADYPERAASERVQTNLAKLGSLTSRTGWRSISGDQPRAQGREVGGTLPAVLNAANEVRSTAFVNRRLDFPGISETVRRTLDAHRMVPPSDPGGKFWKRMAGRGGMPRRDFTPAEGCPRGRMPAGFWRTFQMARVARLHLFKALLKDIRRIATGVFICILNRVDY